MEDQTNSHDRSGPPPSTAHGPADHATAQELVAVLSHPGGVAMPGPVDTPFGAALEPMLREACHGRLAPVSWFRTTWQRGGALTGYSQYDAGDGPRHGVVVKMPVPPGERVWLGWLQGHRDLVPRLFASGTKLGEYDIAWVVMERLPHGPLGSAWGGKEFDLLVEAAGRFYLATQELSFKGDVPTKNYERIFELTRKNLRTHDLRDEQRWKNALKKVHKKLKEWLDIWHNRRCDDWCHGDLHLANALTRDAAPAGPAVLIDFAQCHAGHWIEDAVYFEHLYWCRRHKLGDRRICSAIAHERKRLGLHVDADWPRLASVRRALLAMSTPAMLDQDGDPNHVKACLEVLEIECGHA